MTKGSFNARRPDLKKLLKTATVFIDDMFDHCPMHFIAHLMHASEVIGYSHPDLNIATTWLSIYIMIVHELHLRPETKEHFDKRLADDSAQVKRENKYDEECYRTQNYGDNTGIINEVI